MYRTPILVLQLVQFVDNLAQLFPRLTCQWRAANLACCHCDGLRARISHLTKDLQLGGIGAKWDNSQEFLILVFCSLCTTPCGIITEN